MIRPRAIVRDKELIYTGSFIAGADEPVVIMPFDDDSEYKMRFTVTTNTESEVKNSILVGDDDIIEIEHSRPATLVLPTASRPRGIFAKDETYKYYINYSVSSCRSPTGQVFQVHYHVLRKPV